ncbi:MAG: hypothetical protein COA94_07350 [Rickettsiales bacterium]|nr:MAG: hypothetical protein COA94_07350 [Rickettsiales bacterium]
MKKILLTTAAAAVLATSSAYASEADTFSVGVHAGMIKPTDEKFGGMKYKSSAAGFAELSVNYAIMDNVRVGAAFSHFFNPKYKASWEVKHADIDGGTFKHILSKTKAAAASVKAAADLAEPDAKFKTVLKAKFSTFLVNGFVDVADLGAAKIFVGAGVGLSRTSAKFKKTSTTVATKAIPANTATNQKEVKVGDVLTGPTKSGKIKSKTNFAYALYLGASTEVAPGINAELAYSFRGFGKLKDVKKASLKGHNVSVGVRFDI